MSQKTIQLSFFALFTTGLLVILFFIFKPYLGVIFLASVLAITFYPWYQKLVEKFGGRKSLASLTTTLLVLVFIIIPVAVLSVFLLKEAADLYNSMAMGNSFQSLISGVNAVIERVNSLLPFEALSPDINFELYARNVLNWIIGHFDSVFAAVFGGALNFILMLLSLYYLFIFGDKVRGALTLWSPLPDRYDEEFIDTLKSSIDAVLRGRIVVSVAQGFLIGLGFAIFGVGSPVLWGFVGSITSLVPMLGTSIITIPAIAFLLFSGEIGSAIGLLIWSGVAVGLVDNFLSVFLLRGKIRVHPLLVLFAIFGGVEVFGAIGLLVGPVVVSAFIALMKIYPFVISFKEVDVHE